MGKGLGIDTGGTYTDAVIYDFDTGRVLASSKALTTRDDLSQGINNAIDRLPEDYLKQAKFVSLSTTLATNACVEDKGGRGKLLFIDGIEKIIDKYGKEYGLESKDLVFVLKGEQVNGETIGKRRNWFDDADSVAVVELNALSNNSVNENKARRILGESFNLPVVCSNELFNDLNSLRRAAGTLLNARLIPVIGEFIKAMEKSLKMRNINVNTVIVRSDGSLMSSQITEKRAVETLLCGPASSIMGGMALTGEENSIIIDMGGTTTDMAIVRGGMPVIAGEGIDIGKWRTYVKGVYIDTFALGGDSGIRVDKKGHLKMENRRFIPLCIGAKKWPVILKELKNLVLSMEKHTHPLYEFLVAVKDISRNKNYTLGEREFVHRLGKEPLILSKAAMAAGTDIYNFQMDRLEKEGIIARIGLTPTDIMHVKGDFNEYDREASLLGLKFAASCAEMGEDDFASMVYDRIKRTLYFNIIRMLLYEKNPHLREKGLSGDLKDLIEESFYDMSGDSFIKSMFSTTATLVGIGAPIHIFLPEVAQGLNTRWVIPENAAVANAVGAVVGNISASYEVTIKPRYSPGGITAYDVYGKDISHVFDREEEAVERAKILAREAAEAEALLRGATGEVAVNVTVVPEIAAGRENSEILLGIKVRADAVGKMNILRAI